MADLKKLIDQLAADNKEAIDDCLTDAVRGGQAISDTVIWIADTSDRWFRSYLSTMRGEDWTQKNESEIIARASVEKRRPVWILALSLSQSHLLTAAMPAAAKNFESPRPEAATIWLGGMLDDLVLVSTLEGISMKRAEH